MYHKNFKHLPWVESKEVARPTICGFDTQKSHSFRVYFAVFSGTAHELVMPAKPPNTHPRPHLMPKEPTDLLNWSRRWKISDVQNFTLYYKIDKVIQYCSDGYTNGHWPKAIHNTWPLVSISNRTRDIISWKIGFCHWEFWNTLITRTVVRVIKM